MLETCSFYKIFQSRAPKMYLIYEALESNHFREKTKEFKVVSKNSKSEVLNNLKLFSVYTTEYHNLYFKIKYFVEDFASEAYFIRRARVEQRIWDILEWISNSDQYIT